MITKYCLCKSPEQTENVITEIASKNDLFNDIKNNFCRRTLKLETENLI
jgi:hypothetical protein